MSEDHRRGGTSVKVTFLQWLKGTLPDPPSPVFYPPTDPDDDWEKLSREARKDTENTGRVVVPPGVAGQALNLVRTHRTSPAPKWVEARNNTTIPNDEIRWDHMAPREKVQAIALVCFVVGMLLSFLTMLIGLFVGLLVTLPLTTVGGIVVAALGLDDAPTPLEQLKAKIPGLVVLSEVAEHGMVLRHISNIYDQAKDTAERSESIETKALVVFLDDDALDLLLWDVWKDVTILQDGTSMGLDDPEVAAVVERAKERLVRHHKDALGLLKAVESGSLKAADAERSSVRVRHLRESAHTEKSRLRE